jgi:hypothetical protein
MMAVTWNEPQKGTARVCHILAISAVMEERRKTKKPKIKSSALDKTNYAKEQNQSKCMLKYMLEIKYIFQHIGAISKISFFLAY